MNQYPDEEIHRVRSWTKGLLFLWSLGPSTVAHGSILVPHLEALRTPSLLGFYGGFITQAQLINSLAIGD